MNEVPMEVIVSDNSSTDEADNDQKNFPWVKFIEGENEGFQRQ